MQPNCLATSPRCEAGVTQCSVWLVCVRAKKHLTVFFPSQGLLREEDLEHLDEDFRRNFHPRRADNLSADNLGATD